jgi:hypothetical protein
MVGIHQFLTENDGAPKRKNPPEGGFFGGSRDFESLLWNLVWCGTRRTVAWREARFSAGLEFAGKYGVPKLVTINKSASYGVRWNRIGIFEMSARCRSASSLEPHTEW